MNTHISYEEFEVAEMLDRDSDMLLNESLYDEVKENFLCSVICSG